MIKKESDILNIGILGGDLRIIILSKMLLDEGYDVYSYGIEKEVKYNHTIECSTINQMCKLCNVIISGIPFSKDGIILNSPFSNKELSVDKSLVFLCNKTLIAGAIKPEIREKAIENNVKIIDLMDNERLTILNVIPTVEGAICTAIENTEFTLHDSDCLVLGYGRIGKLLSKTLRNLGANVSTEARNEKDLAWINLYGYKEISLYNLDEDLNKNKYDVIFNTIPTLILDDKKLKIIKEKNKDTIIIELASNPGGIDFKKAEEYNLKVIKALGVPGKVAPFTAAKYIKETIGKILN